MLPVLTLLGVAAGALGVALATLPWKYGAAAMVGLGTLPAVLLIGRQRLAPVLAFALGAVIPTNLDINFFNRPHVGGASSLNVSASDIVVVALAAVTIFLRPEPAEGRPRRAGGGIIAAQVAFMAVGVVSLVNADYAELTLLELAQLVKLLLLCWTVMSLRSELLTSCLLLGLAAGAVGQGALAVAQYQGGAGLGLSMLGERQLVEQRLGYTFYRPTGTIGHPNSLAYYFEILIPLTLALGLVEAHRLRKLAYFVACLAGFVGILLTLSRAAWLTVPISVGLVLLLLRRAAWAHLRDYRAIIVAVAGLCVLAWMAPTIERRFTHSDYQSSGSRWPLNEAAFSLIEQFPVVGVGLNNFSAVFKRYDETGHSRIFAGYQHVVHNLYLWVWAEVGTLGLIAFLSLFAVTLATGVRVLTGRHPGHAAIAAGVLAGLLAHLIHGFFDPGFRVSPSVSVLVYGLVGLVGSMARRPALAVPS